ncbi:MAG TPA: hypothetical protein VME67_00560 [Mycobacterium sp.]|nr:hypothetical protein [Mycobacterium sp.]HTX93439.1 hypothetical protein [Mycobacterium sp.]
MLLPLGSPLPDDAVSAVRGESGMLGGLSVPLRWGVAVPPDDYDHWAPKAKVPADPDDQVPVKPTPVGGAEGVNEWGQWKEWNRCGEDDAEPRFEVPRTGGVIPHSPAAG